MTKHSENENFLLHALLLWQSKIVQEMNILISPLNNCFIGKAKISISTQFGQKKTITKIWK